MFENKTLLITGGTGSFGNAVLQRFLKSDFQEIRIFSRDEKKQEDMRIALRDDRVKFYIGDVRDYEAVDDAVVGVDYVFHAAALKQVPSCEFYPMEAIRTNVLGAENVMRAAVNRNVSKCVLLSTDKAVYPINAMGMSKAMMEKVMVAKSRLCQSGQTVLCATRYGNVMGSRGSVIPLFIDQLQQGKPLTITDPGMTRFLMSLEESVDLVLYAFQTLDRVTFSSRRRLLPPSVISLTHFGNYCRLTISSESLALDMARSSMNHLSLARRCFEPLILVTITASLPIAAT